MGKSGDEDAINMFENDDGTRRLVHQRWCTIKNCFYVSQPTRRLRRTGKDIDSRCVTEIIGGDLDSFARLNFLLCRLGEDVFEIFGAGFNKVEGITLCLWQWTKYSISI